MKKYKEYDGVYKNEEFILLELRNISETHKLCNKYIEERNIEKGFLDNYSVYYYVRLHGILIDKFSIILLKFNI